MHARGVDDEEERTEGDEAEERGYRHENVALAVAVDRAAGEARGEEGGDGFEVVVDAEDERKMGGGVAVMTALQAGVEVEVDVLEAERDEEDEGSENFAGATGLKPAFNPDEDHADEEDVG